jgi:hypothetical protein
MTQETITRDYCQDKTLLFYPESNEEAKFIQESLLKIGFSTRFDSKKLINPEQCIQYGIMLTSYGVVSITITDKERKSGLVCNSSQFDPPFDKKAIATPAQRPQVATSKKPLALLGMFNQMATQIEALTQEVAALRKEIAPKHLEKDEIRFPKKKL